MIITNNQIAVSVTTREKAEDEQSCYVYMGLSYLLDGRNQAVKIAFR